MEQPCQYSPAHSCKHCQRIVLRRENFSEDSFKIKLPHTVSELREGIKNGCALLLQLFVSGWDASTYKNRLEYAVSWRRDAYSVDIQKKLSQRWRRKFRQCWSLFEQGLWNVKFHFEAHHNFYSFYVKLPRTLLPPPSFEHHCRHGLYYTWISSLKASPDISADEIPESIKRAQDPYVGSENSLRQAGEWLTTCHGAHPLCSEMPTDFVPTRLLKLGTNEDQHKVQLIHTSPGDCVAWVALSYVWGGDQSFKTTVSSMTEMHRQIPVITLPQTLQDAVIVCRGIGIQYLWVDCLCIVQDDADDLSRELAFMPKIYQRAWVTISASTADDVSKGFLQDRGYKVIVGQTPLEKSPVFSLPYVFVDGIRTSNIILGEAREPTDETETTPIHQRAWTYQERRLSPRVLIFTKTAITFICRTGEFRRGSGSHPWVTRGAETWDEQERILPCIQSQDLPSWHAIVKDYVIRELTFPSDKLRAIAALADLYRIKNKQTYVAGLWKETIVLDLCWYSRYPVDKFARVSTPRPREYRAPSWSWAAIDVEATRQLRFLENTMPRGISPSNNFNTIWNCHLEQDAVLVDLVLEQIPPNTTYGQIRSASLTLEGLALNTKWSFNEGYHSLQNLGSDSVFVPDSILTPGSILRRSVFPTTSMFTTRDAMEDMTPTTADEWPVVAFILVRGTGGIEIREKFVFGLLLVEEASGQHRRVGTFQMALGPDRYETYDCPLDTSKMFQRRSITII
ncbi:hypothetical protein HBI56_186060 [Parastagonospora nodorum]|nr:hypothetical protein HBH95_188630 [Parastagonospora nodorum]KAH6494133.1 hypothetical protein HBI56_186060 [Parastagonospora nodorum]